MTHGIDGKSTRADGTPVTTDTGEVFWGEPGTNGQHAFYQLIHQGTRLIPADFIGFSQPTDDLPTLDGTGSMHDLLMSNFFAQTQVLAFGKTAEEIAAEGTSAQVVPHKVMPGNRPSTSILANRLTPSVVGQLIALYEHRALHEGVIWASTRSTNGEWSWARRRPRRCSRCSPATPHPRHSRIAPPTRSCVATARSGHGPQ